MEAGRDDLVVVIVPLLELGQKGHKPRLPAIHGDQAANGNLEVEDEKKDDSSEICSKAHPHLFQLMHRLQQRVEDARAALHHRLVWVQEVGFLDAVLLLEPGPGLEAQEHHAYSKT